MSTVTMVDLEEFQRVKAWIEEGGHWKVVPAEAAAPLRAALERLREMADDEDAETRAEMIALIEQARAALAQPEREAGECKNDECILPSPHTGRCQYAQPAAAPAGEGGLREDPVRLLVEVAMAWDSIAFYNSGTEREPVESLTDEDHRLLEAAFEDINGYLGDPRAALAPEREAGTRPCPRCAHRPHAPHECEARYHVTFEKGEPGDPCLCSERAAP